ncbi:hypothetical protein pb186bvf_009908 [Paramecium bursaria]
MEKIQKVVELIETANLTQPKIPTRAFLLDPTDPEWDDDMTLPVIEYEKFIYQAGAFGVNLFLYAYNYNVFTANIRLRLLRYLFPVINIAAFTKVYADYKEQLTKVNLFDQYVYLRAQELVAQNEYLLEHEGLLQINYVDVKRFVWWYEDYKETLGRVHRQANDHEASDFKDSEIILQDFIKRYTNPKENRPLNIANRAAIF